MISRTIFFWGNLRTLTNCFDEEKSPQSLVLSIVEDLELTRRFFLHTSKQNYGNKMGPLILGRQIQINLPLFTIQRPDLSFRLLYIAMALSKNSFYKFFMARLQNQNLLGVGGVVLFPPAGHVDEVNIWKFMLSQVPDIILQWYQWRSRWPGIPVYFLSLTGTPRRFPAP